MIDLARLFRYGEMIVRVLRVDVGEARWCRWPRYCADGKHGS